MTIETRPSAAHRWTKCSAAPLFANGAGPAPTSDAAREGTCAAWVAELMLANQPAEVGMTHPNGWEVDADMIGHMQAYADICRADGGEMWVEEHVRLNPRVAGTADCITLVDGMLTVRDLKYGFRLVAPDSPQLIIYAAAMVAGTHSVTSIRTEIYQPRGFHRDGPRRWIDWTPDQIRAKAEWIIERAEECYKPDPIATPGDHCLYCDGAVGCVALQQTTVTALAIAEMTGHRDRTPFEMSQALHFYRNALEIITAAARATEVEAEARARRGERLPGWGLLPRFGNTRVKASPAAIKALTGKDATKIVPMNVGDLKLAGLTEAQLSLITERPTAGHKLAPLDQDTLTRQLNRSAN
jgi:hypothetical protein